MAFYALVDNEIGVQGVGENRKEAIRHYADWLNDQGYGKSLSTIIQAIYEQVMGGGYDMQECTKELYEDFMKYGNADSYDHNEVGLLTLWPED